MTYNEFVALITCKSPSLDDYRRVVEYVESASIETLWSALTSGGVHPIFVAVINKALQEKVAQANLDNAMANIAKGPRSPKSGG